MSDDDIVKFILSGNTTQITVEQLGSLLKYAPTSDEIEQLNSYTGNFKDLAPGKSF